jgi:hypothetical protein
MFILYITSRYSHFNILFSKPCQKQSGLTKPGEVGEILALYRLKSLSLDYRAKLKSPCFFLQVPGISSVQTEVCRDSFQLLYQQIKPSLLLE